LAIWVFPDACQPPTLLEHVDLLSVANSSAAGPSHISPPTPQCSIPPMGLAVSDLPPGPSYINSTGSPTSFDRSPVFLGFFDLTGGTLAHGPDIDTSARGPSFIDLTMIDDTL
jgi:hypothetical protein